MTDPPKSKAITRDEWLKALAEIGLSSEHDAEAITIGEFAALFGVPIGTARHRLNRLVAAGKATRTRKNGVSRYGRATAFVAYRLAK